MTSSEGSSTWDLWAPVIDIVWWYLAALGLIVSMAWLYPVFKDPRGGVDAVKDWLLFRTRRPRRWVKRAWKALVELFDDVWAGASPLVVYAYDGGPATATVALVATAVPPGEFRRRPSKVAEAEYTQRAKGKDAGEMVPWPQLKARLEAEAEAQRRGADDTAT